MAILKLMHSWTKIYAYICHCPTYIYPGSTHGNYYTEGTVLDINYLEDILKSVARFCLVISYLIMLIFFPCKAKDIHRANY